MGGKGQKKRKGKTRWSKSDSELTLLSLPAIVWYIAFSFLPMFGLIIAFKDYKVFRGSNFIGSLLQSEWVGFNNFTFLFESNTFGILLRNTLVYNIVFIILGMTFAVGLAILINELYHRFFSKVCQTLMFFPHFLSWVVVSYFVYAILNPDKGLANLILGIFGQDPVRWYSEEQYWPFILVIMYLWKSIGYSMVVYLASIAGIDQALYEAAMLDGASKWQQTKYITIPSIKPIIIMMFILAVGKIFYSDFGLFYQVTQGVPNSLADVASTFDTYIYNALRSGSVSIGRTTAASMFQSVCCCITILLANFIVSKVDEDSAII